MKAVVEDSALASLVCGGSQFAHEPDLAADLPAPESRSGGDVALAGAYLPKLQGTRH